MSSPVLPDDLQLDVPAVIVPDRADAPISEITERFFRAVLLKVPLDRIEELHLFSPLRQGGVETGIAVIAAREVIVVPVAEAPAEPTLAEPELPLEETPVVEAAIEELAQDELVHQDLAHQDVAHEDVAHEDIAHEEIAADEADRDAHVIDTDDSPYADEAVAATLAESDTSTAQLDEVHPEPVPEPETVIVAAPAPKIRHTVFTARYRLVQKGPERGKWEADVVAEAEAPLITVETVVRGVQRRAGEESDTTRFTAPQIARALRLNLGAA